MAKKNEVERNWVLVDATDVPLGRLSAVVASILRGKNKPTYTPHVDTGDFVVIVNADKVALTGKKATDIAAGVNNTDAVNVSQLTPLATALGATVNPTTGAVEVPNLVVTKTDGTQAAPVNTVQGALDNIGTELQKGLTFGGDNADKNFERKLGNQVFVKGGADAAKLSDNNIGVVSDDLNGTLNVKLAKDLQGLNSAQFETDGNVTTINGGNVSLADKDGNIAETTANGITLTPVPSSGKEAVSLTKDGLNNGGNKVTDIAAGEADTDAVNVAQLKAAAAKATSKVDSGNDNIVVTPEQNADGSTTYKVATAPNLKADSFTAGDTVVNNDGVKVGDKVALGKDGLKAGDVNITADGINAGNKAISNVAAGVKDTDAANVGQLNRLTAAAKTEVEAGTNIASVSSKQGANGQTVYTVNADGASVSAGSDNIVVTKGNKDANNVTDYAVDLSKAVKADIAKGVAAKDAVDNKGISFAGDSGTTVANKLGDTVAVKGDANITTTAGANGIQVGLNKDLKVDSVKAGDTVVNNNGVNVGDKVALDKDGLKAGDVNITADGINAGGKKVTGVAAGTVAAGSTDAVNGGQLHQVYELIGSNGGNVNTAPPSVEADGKAGLGNIKNITLVDNSNNRPFAKVS